MKCALLLAFFLAVATGAEAARFNTKVSEDYDSQRIRIETKTPSMSTNPFLALGGHTVSGRKAWIGRKKQVTPPNGIYAHATFVFNTTRNGANYTVNINAGRVHITSWYPYRDQGRSWQCHVYENGACACSRTQWNICGNATILGDFQAPAQESRRAAKAALEAEGVTVTNN